MTESYIDFNQELNYKRDKFLRPIYTTLIVRIIIACWLIIERDDLERVTIQGVIN